MEFISKEKIVELSNPGVVSRQLLNPENSSSERVTITEVHLEIGACPNQDIHMMRQNKFGMQRKERVNYYLQMNKKKCLLLGML